jgi:transcription-repair coupling factor (superfamily II helicase)
MHDLEIRGAGEILGAEQSGHIAAVGFETYCRLLEEAIAEARGTPPPSQARAQLSLGFSASIPRVYVPEDGLRLSIYKRVADAESGEELVELASELEDRFGEPPPEVSQLLSAARLRVLATALGIEVIDRSAGRLTIRFGASRRAPLERVLAFVQRVPGAALAPDGSLTIPTREAGPALLERCLGFVAEIGGTS